MLLYFFENYITVNVWLLMKKTLLDHVRLAKGLTTTPLRTDVRMQLGHSNDKLAQGEYNRMMTTDIFLSIR